MQLDQLKRREFITLLVGATAAGPLAARAQQPAAMPSICASVKLASKNLQQSNRDEFIFESTLRGGKK
jgi:hypothetical protein